MAVGGAPDRGAGVATLVLAAGALIALPFVLPAAGLSVTSATEVVIFAIACLALNILVGYTGLVSFGHGAWFGLGAYAAALSQRHWFPGSMVVPALFALAFIAVQREFGGFAEYLWGMAGGEPLVNHPASTAELPVTSELSDRLSKDLKKRGFTFVGSTIIYAMMQATGMVNDHVLTCPRHAVVKAKS